ncbi:MAG: AraC family transcriptional regulator [Tunicatimonas sp.]|uniref:AraC family transcriptional regulator n=1 Tax=Tunicatimonas sp. TaxID=1940096 RepID=UPI003C78FDBC
MRAAVNKVSIPDSDVFVIQDLQEPYFDPNWHAHPDYQLFVVLEGTGTRFIGDNVQPFQPGDMVFTGPNLPHLWHSDDTYFQEENDLKTRGIVIYFHQDFLGEGLLQKREMSKVRQLFERAQLGLNIYGNTNRKVKVKILSLLHIEGFPSVLCLLEIINLLAHSSEYKLISSVGYTHRINETDTERMNRVHDYVMHNYKQNISLEKVASLANMTPSSFSRYFKVRANKTFSAFVSDIRIGHACKLLQENQMNIAQVSYECGYRTLSNFNKQFRDITNRTPSKYKNEYAEIVHS